MNKIYTGIGARNTPVGALQWMRKISIALAQDGWLLRSGHAEGADQAFEKACINAAGTKEIYLPWAGFNQKTMEEGYHAVDTFPNYAEALDIASKFYPNWDACSAGTKKLHARNVYQIVGFDLQTPVNMVVCWTLDAKREGGTGQALRIAEYLNIPIFDLAIENNIIELTNFVNSVYSPPQ